MKINNPVNGASALVLSAAVGAGHIRAADALVTAFQNKGVPAQHMEVLKHTNSFFKKAYSDLYLELVNKRPELLRWVYNSLDRPWCFQRRRLILDRLNTGTLIKLLKKEQPGFALCTHFLPAEILLYLKKKRKLDIPVGIVITDFDAHALWIYRHVDWYFVASKETKAYLSEVGVPGESIYVTGIPIGPSFSKEMSHQKARKLLDLEPNRKTILISAGGFGKGPIESIVREIFKIKHPIQLVVICGKNEKLRQRLKIFSCGMHTMKIVGYTNEMHMWMAASDLLVGKPGGLTSSEALARGLIMVIVNPVPGQEERNSDHLLEEGVAIRCNNLPALAYKIESLLVNADRTKKMRDAANRMSRPYAASDITDIVRDQLCINLHKS